MSENNTELTLPLEKNIKAIQLPETRKKVEQKNPLSAYIDSEFLSTLEKQEKEGRNTAALFTDIDFTFFRKDRAEASKKLFKDLQLDNYPTVAVTGNPFSAIEKRIQSGELPYFPVIIGAVGTEIYILHEKNGEKIYKKDESYEEMLLEKGFNRPQLAIKAQQIVEDLGGKNPQYPKSHLEWGLKFQESEKEQAYREGTGDAQKFKISFHALASNNASLEEMRTEVSKRFSEQKVVICEDIDYNNQMKEGDTNKKYNIDILAATKGEAVDYIAEKTGIKFEIRAGDSGNDLEMLTGNNADVSISVGGARPELRDVIHKNIFGGEINKDIKVIKDSDGKNKTYVLSIGTDRGPESITKIFKDVKIMQESSTIEMLKKEKGRKEFEDLLKKQH